MTRPARLVLTVLLLLGASAAQAKLITWTLQDVTFTRIGPLHGSFQFDPTTGAAPSVWSFTYLTSSGPLASSSVDISGGQTRLDFINNELPSNMAGTIEHLQLRFDRTLPAAGGTVVLAGGSFSACNVFASCPVQAQLIGGSVTSVPEPGMLTFVVIGAMTLLVAQRGVARRGAAGMQHRRRAVSS